MTAQAQHAPVTLRHLAALLAQYEAATDFDRLAGLSSPQESARIDVEAAAKAITFVEHLLQSPLAEQIRRASSADLSKLTGPGRRDAMWALGFGAGAAWEGGFMPNRLRELVEARVLIPTETPGRFTVGWLDGDPRFPQV